MLTPQPPRRRRSQKGVGSPTAQQPNSPTATRAVAALGPDGRRRFAPRSARPSAAMARRDVRLRDPFRMRRGAQRSADQGSRLSERRRREFERDPAGREHRRLPAAKRRDAACRVAFSLVTFFWRSVWTGDIVNRCADTWFTDLIKRPRCQPGQLPSSDGVRRTPQSSRPCPAWAGYPPCGDAGHCSACIACP